MTFGRPPTIPNSYMTGDLPQDVDLEDLDLGPGEERNPNMPASLQPRSTASLYVHSM